MLARMIETNNGQYQILYADGTMAMAGHRSVRTFLQEHKNAASFTGRDGKWKSMAMDMALYDGRTCAYISDDGILVILDFEPFARLMDLPAEPDYISTKEFAARYNRSSDMIKILCREGRIPGAKKVGNSWLIPENAEYPIAPEDMRDNISELHKKPKKLI